MSRGLITAGPSTARSSYAVSPSCTGASPQTTSTIGASLSRRASRTIGTVVASAKQSRAPLSASIRDTSPDVEPGLTGTATMPARSVAR